MSAEPESANAWTDRRGPLGSYFRACGTGRLYAATLYSWINPDILKMKIGVGIGRDKGHPGSSIHRIRFAVRIVIAMTLHLRFLYAK